jgi:hypothetical protein
LPDSPLELLDGLCQISAQELRVPIDRLKVLDTTYFLAASIVRAKGSIHSAIHSGRSPFAGHRHAACIIS